ncbi:MAG: alkaline phosphatase family protein [Gammaproteobacteria bacterium]|nr:alkaline phosphatase family protein [Gammaproteobacteria bacterium]
MTHLLSELHVPDYGNASIVNLMASISLGLGSGPVDYPALRELPPDELADARNVLLLVVDGLGYEYLRGQGDTHLGRHVRARLTSVFPSTTASAITTFLTGTAPLQHAVTGWYMYFRELGAVSAVLPFTPRIGGPSYGRRGVDPTRFFGHRTVFDHLAVPSYLVAPDAILDSDFSRSHCGRAVRTGYRNLAGLMDRVHKLLRRNRKRRYVYAYWSELDSLAHRHGVGSGEVAEHLMSLDAAIADLCAGLAGSDTAVIVTADHGLLDTDVGSRLWLDDHPELAESLALPLCGEPRAAYCYVRPGRRASFRDYVHGELTQQAYAFTSDELVEGGLFGNGTAHPRLRERIGDFTLVMKGNYVMRDRLWGETPPDHVGVHGGVSSAEMYVPLVVRRL